VVRETPCRGWSPSCTLEVNPEPFVYPFHFLDPSDAPPSTLSDAELIDLVLREPTSSGRRGDAILHALGGFAGLVNADPAELVGHGLDAAAVAALRAALELGRRLARPAQPRRVVRSPEEVYALLRPLLAPSDREHFMLLTLDAQHRVHHVRVVATGTATAVALDVATVFGLALRLRATSILVAHNHPSGDPKPSAYDRAVTVRLLDAGNVLGVPLLDHVVVASDGFTSIFEEMGYTGGSWRLPEPDAF